MDTFSQCTPGGAGLEPAFATDWQPGSALAMRVAAAAVLCAAVASIVWYAVGVVSAL